MHDAIDAWCSRNVVDSRYVPCAWLYWTCSTKITINAEIFISLRWLIPETLINMQFPASFHDFTWPVPVSDRRITSPVHSGYKGRPGVMRSAQDAFRLIKTSSAALGWPENGDCYIMHKKKCSHIASLTISGTGPSLQWLLCTTSMLYSLSY